jgi:alpha-beta hydrolase superfamily lysophospholipase
MSDSTEAEIRGHDGTPLRVLTWAGDDEVRGLVILVHGLGEHVGRYDPIARALNAIGLTVVGADHRGHGRSGGLRGHVDGYDQYTADVEAVVHHAQGMLGDELPWFVLGHSMGGLITTRYLTDPRRPQPAAAVLSNPQLGLAFEPPKVKVAAGRLLSRILPKLRLDSELDTNAISRDPTEVKKYVDDPLVHSKISTRWYTSMTAALTEAVEQGPTIGIPTLWILSGRDQLCSAPAAKKVAEQVVGSRILDLPDAYHEAHNGPDRPKFLDAVTTFLSEQLPA